MNKFLMAITLLYFSALATLAQANCPSTLWKVGETIEKLALSSPLISQEDPALVNRRYALKSGGLCGASCTYLVKAALEYAAGGEFLPPNAKELIKQTDVFSKRFDIDARKGVWLWQMKKVLESEISKLDGNMSVEIMNLKDSVLTEADFDSKSIYILGAEEFTQLQDGSLKLKWGHVMIVYFNPQLKSLRVINPLHFHSTYGAKITPLSTEFTFDKKDLPREVSLKYKNEIQFQTEAALDKEDKEPVTHRFLAKAIKITLRK